MKKLYLKKAFSVLLAMLMILSMAGISISAEWSEIISETTLDMASSSNYSESYGYNSVLENDYLHVPFVGGNGASPLNYDKCATINHAAFGYDATRTNNEVVIEIDYRPHYEATVGTANPTVECQFKTVTVPDDVTVTSPSASKTYMSLYKIDLATGQLSNAGTVVSSNGLVKDAWNTVSLVINLETGKYDTYVNGTLYATDGYIAKGNEDQNFRKVSVAANQLIVAKCNKVDAYAASESNTHHYIDVDNVHFYTLNDEVRVATDEVAHTYTVKGSTHTALGQRYLVDDATSSTFVVYADALTQQGVATSSLVAPVSGASVRVSSPAGMRFATQLNTTELGKLLTMQNSGMLKNVEIGTMIAPLDHVEAVGNFTASSFDAAGKTYLEVEAVIGDYYSTLDGVTLENGYDAMFVGSIVNIKLDNRDRDFAAVGYVKVTLFSGNEYYYYSYGYDLSAISTNYARNVEEVAESYYNDGGKDLADPLLATLETLMTDRSEMTQYIGDEVSDALTSATELYFTVNGAFCRLTYNGYNGWRLQANGTDYNSFNEMGAAQSLSAYLGEDAKDFPLRIAASANSGKLTVSNTDTANGTYAVIDLNDFSISFYKSNTLMSKLTAVEVDADANTVTLKGELGAYEAVYGGGETFDTTNKRGKDLNLYTYDCYNQDEGTYMAIPLFSTSRGAGFFVNRYEAINVNFGKTTAGESGLAASNANEWIMQVDNELMDCYFYATGSISDVLASYTELSGSATLPEEWMQGVLICRYNSDLTALDSAVPTYTLAEMQTLVTTSWYYGVNNNLNQGKGGVSVSWTEITALSDLASHPVGTYYAYVNSSGSKIISYRKNGADEFVKTTKKGSPIGAGFKQIVENLIEAGMTPTAVITEGWSLGTLSTNAAKRAEIESVIEYLHDKGIKFMTYMTASGSVSSSMDGYKEEYLLSATMTESDGSTSVVTKIPATSGNGTNPDMSGSTTFTYLDLTNPAAVEWYFDTVWQEMIELGVDGVKIDFCEELPDEGVSYGGTTFTYRWYDDSIFEAGTEHHSYPSYMISLFYREINERLDAYKLEAAETSDGFMVLSRGGGIGSQRNPYLWAGDQARDMTTLKNQLIASITSGLSGVPFLTYDMAGYAYSGGSFGYYDDGALETESEIFARAIAYTAFTSVIQTHGDVRHMYELTEEAQTVAANYTALHNELLAYIQELSAEAVETGMPLVRHLVLQYQNDANVYSIDDQFLLGNALMVAPILEADQTSRTVYLPAGTWLDLNTGAEIESPGMTVEVSGMTLGRIPVYLNLNSANAGTLRALFADSETWTAICGGTNPVSATSSARPEDTDPGLQDIFAQQ